MTELNREDLAELVGELARIRHALEMATGALLELAGLDRDAAPAHRIHSQPPRPAVRLARWPTVEGSAAARWGGHRRPQRPPQGPHCFACGTQAPEPDAVTCGRCGARLPVSVPEGPTEPGPEPGPVPNGVCLACGALPAEGAGPGTTCGRCGALVVDESDPRGSRLCGALSPRLDDDAARFAGERVRCNLTPEHGLPHRLTDRYTGETVLEWALDPEPAERWPIGDPDPEGPDRRRADRRGVVDRRGEQWPITATDPAEQRTLIAARALVADQPCYWSPTVEKACGECLACALRKAVAELDGGERAG